MIRNRKPADDTGIGRVVLRGGCWSNALVPTRYSAISYCRAWHDRYVGREYFRPDLRKVIDS